MLRAKKRRDSKAETGKENISSMDEHAFQKTFRENVDELPMEQVKINENLVAHVTAICTGDFPKTVIESTSNEPNNFCTCRNRADKSISKPQLIVNQIFGCGSS
ncbi:hypothetical protein Y032_0224g2720 [Ancylostoma ceylanicum]|nr:hypothetical protein Y032_0224g2720 [Ancylostoma ceylanicum]